MRKLITPTIVLALIASGASAQEAREEAAPGTTARAGTDSARPGNRAGAAQGNKLDQQIAACMLLGNQEEIALAQFAQEHAEHEQVKQFAQMMIEQHQQAVAKIEQAAPQVASLKLKLTANEGERTTPGQPPQTNTTTTGGVDQQALALMQQVKQECLSLTKEELGEMKGAKFDKAYIGQQVGAHIAMLAQLRGSKDFASAELQQVIEEGEQMTEKHMTKAKEIMKELKDDARDAPQAARRSDKADPSRK